ncbi:MAG: SAF domain-containing protein [Intestinibacter sp.]
MAKNPMQRKAQNSFLLGMLITLLITGIIIAVLVIQLTKITKEQNEAKANLKQVYVLSQDINSGDTVTTDILTLQTMDASTIPSNALSLAELTAKSDIVDENGNLIQKMNVVSKIDLKKGTIITSDMIAVQDELAADLRKVEYNMIVLPTQLENGKYIDIRLKLPTGEDFIVISHKQVEIPTVEGIDSLNSIWLNLDETEILTLSCAIVESYQIQGSLLYITEYVEPGLQGAATATYLPNDTTINLINKDPNCVAEAKNALFQRNNDQSTKNSVRNPVNNNLNNNADDAIDNVIDNVEEEIRKTQEERQTYLESLGG